MKTKKIIFIALLSLILVSICFSQNQISNNNPVGEWCQDKIGNSEFFFDITESEIKYIEKKTEKYRLWNYQLKMYEDCSLIQLDNFDGIGTLALNEINKDLYYYLTKVAPELALKWVSTRNPVIPFQRKDNDYMSLVILVKGKKGELEAKEMKLVTRAKKQATIDAWKTAGEVAVAATAVYGAYKAYDYISGNADMNDIAKDCLKASKAY